MPISDNERNIVGTLRQDIVCILEQSHRNDTFRRKHTAKIKKKNNNNYIVKNISHVYSLKYITETSKNLTHECDKNISLRCNCDILVT